MKMANMYISLAKELLKSAKRGPCALMWGAPAVSTRGWRLCGRMWILSALTPIRRNARV